MCVKYHLKSPTLSLSIINYEQDLPKTSNGINSNTTLNICS